MAKIKKLAVSVVHSYEFEDIEVDDATFESLRLIAVSGEIASTKNLTRIENFDGFIYLASKLIPSALEPDSVCLSIDDMIN